MRFAIVVVGASLGGLEAMETLLAGLPEQFALPVAVVLHRPSQESDLAELLQRHCVLPVGEPEDKMGIEAGRVYLAPAGYHLLVEAGSFALSTDPPVCHARPSIDVLFESAADAYRDRVVGVALTGASQDGARGLATIKGRGGFAIVQDPAQAQSPVLPEAVLAATAVDRVLPIAEVAPLLAGLSQLTVR